MPPFVFSEFLAYGLDTLQAEAFLFLALIGSLLVIAGVLVGYVVADWKADVRRNRDRAAFAAAQAQHRARFEARRKGSVNDAA